MVKGLFWLKYYIAINIVDFLPLIALLLIQPQKMKISLFYTVAFVFGSVLTSSAQVFTPSASELPEGDINQPYIGQVINFIVAESVAVDGADFGLPFSLPLDASVTDASWEVEGLPAGLTATCDATPCTYVANASGYITISGTPTEGGTFTVDITSQTNGAVTLPAPISQTIAFPQAVPGLLDEIGYTLVINDPSGIAERNNHFAIDFFPNPTEGNSTLEVNSTISGIAVVEIYSITGALVSTNTEVVRVGTNRLKVDLESDPDGIYLVKAEINGTAALIKIQKK